MVEVAGGEGTRRRLPPWMQGKASTPSGDRDKSDKVQEVGDEFISGNFKPRKQSKKASEPIEKGETKRRKRKICQQDAPCDSENASPVKMSIGLREKQIQEPSHRQRNKTNVRLRSGKDSKTPSPIEDDEEELSPEDLLSIAKEYVKADKDIGLQELSTGDCEFGKQLSTIASPKAKSESSLIAIDGNRKSPVDETTYDLTESPKGDKHLINTSRTGDPAHDMLDLFLGPLLKKPVDEKRTEFVRRDLTFSKELGKGSQNDVKEETVPLTKKKCTLRDKVAMLLD
ncbi:hypothetical protein E1A91_D02G161100v1 [Gossypium mustelinum]|uniref:Uncharacterized protein n=3 Tax=Gossypium TaxID=3633 RepID=A0A5J5SF46_GOSBA|nr:hypothetical protein ES319_D02G155100v1 [Gossypium barbadense]TYG79810.1 hypothetical protein ES288_D02G166900v1 [Gossypium darwinii]TYI93826.1 hypothetical protein E1A91_D02G161100v1 [Gossypium mustelinum]